MAGEDASLAEVILAGIETALGEVHKALPGKVTAYDPVTNTAIVKPQIKKPLTAADGGVAYEDIPEIPFVPVLWPRTAGYAITFPLAVGDCVLLIFCDTSLAEWRESGDVAEPLDARRHSVGWPVAIPGFFPDATALSSAPDALAARAAGMVIGEDGGSSRIEITPTAIKLGKDAAEFVALASKVDAFINAFCNAVPVATDGGAAIQTAAKTAWTTAGGTCAASKTKAQ